MTRRNRNRADAYTVLAVASMLAGMVAVAVSVAGYRAADLDWWVGSAVIAACFAATGLILLGVAWEAARTERNHR